MNSSPPIRIQVFLNGSMDGDQIRSLFNGNTENFVFRFAISRDSFFEKLKTFNPQIVLIDCVAVGNKIGLFISQVRQQHPDLKIIMIGETEDEQLIMDSIRAGVDHFLFKHHLDRLPELVQHFSTFSPPVIDQSKSNAVDFLNYSRLHLLSFAYHHTLLELLQESLDQICQLTGSEVGFFHFLEADQTTISLQAWSTNTIESFCHAAGRGLHYDIDKAGVWVDAIRERRPVIHNDYASLDHKKGLPEGHAPVLRELVVPIFRGDLIVAVLGVGNKAVDYDDNDIKTVSYFTDLIWDIAARKKIETQLLESEERFRVFVENANDTVFTLNRQGQFQYISPNWEEILGESPEKALGKSYQDYVHPDDVVYCNEFMQKIFTEGGKHSGLEYRTIAKNGKWCWHTISASLLPDDSGGEPILLGISHDITARIETEQKLIESEATIRKRLLAITTPDGDVDTLELADLIDWDALNSMMDDFCELTHFVIGIVDLHGKVLVSKGWQEICTKFHRCNPETLKNCMASDKELSQNVMPGTFKFYKCKNNMWDISTPLMLNNRHVGNIFMGQFFFEDEVLDIEIFRKQANRYGFDEEAYIKALHTVPRLNPETVATVMNFYTKLSGLISSLSFSNIQLARSLAEKDRLLADLKESEERYHNLVDYLPTPIFIVNRGIYQYANPAGLMNLGYESLDELVGVHVMQTIHPDSIPFLLQRIQALENGQENAPMELKVLRKDGDVRLMESTSVQITLNGEPCTLILNHDITDRKLAEEQLEAANDRLRALWSVASLTDTNDPKLISDHVLETITQMTNSDFGFYGFVNEEETIMTIHSWSGNALKECEIQDKPQYFPIRDAGIWGESVRNQKVILLNEYEADHPGKKGLPFGHVPIHNLLIVPLLGNGKTISVAAVANSPRMYSEEDVNQITTFLTSVQGLIDRTRAELARVKSEALLKDALQLMKTGAWEWDVARQTITWSEEVYRIHGASPSEYPNESNALMGFSLSCYHPDDRVIVKEAFAECLNSGHPYTLEVRFQPLSGPEKWVRTIGKPVFEGEKVIRVNGYIMDITQRRLAEQELQKQQKLLEASQRTAHLGSFEVDLASNMTRWTQESYKLFGWEGKPQPPTPAEYEDIVHPEDFARVNTAYQQSLTTGEELDLVYRVCLMDGTLRYIHNLGESELDYSGKATRFFGTFQDITDSKVMELALQRSLEEKEVLLREVHHRVKNNLAAILGLIEMERFDSMDPALENRLTNLGIRIKSIATVHETLYKSDDMSKIKFQNYLESLMDNLLTSLECDETTKITIEANEIEFDLNLAVPCGLIVNELVTNCLKHAFPASGKELIHGKQAEIHISVTQEDDLIILSVSDNGIGLPADLDIHTVSTLGLRLICMLGEHQLGGKLAVNRNEGTLISLAFSRTNRM